MTVSISTTNKINPEQLRCELGAPGLLRVTPTDEGFDIDVEDVDAAKFNEVVKAHIADPEWEHPWTGIPTEERASGPPEEIQMVQ